MQATLPRGASAYQQVQIQSRSPIELVVMLYDGALKFLTQARDAMDRRDLVTKRDAMSRALAIIAELQNTLDMEAGGDIARSLDELYTYVTGRLIEANVKGDPAPVDEAVRLLAPLRESWAEIAKPSPPAGA